MANEHGNPQNIDERNWYYEEKQGIVLVHEVVDSGEVYMQTDQITIPWRMLKKTAKRKGWLGLSIEQ